MSQTLTSIPLNVKKADLLLIYPDFAKNTLGTASYPENHLGLNRLASYIHEKGYSVKVLNTTGLPEGTRGPDMLAQFLRNSSNDYEIIGFHANSWNISHIIKTLSLINKKFKNKLILFGGPLPTAEPQKVINLVKSIGYNNIGLVQGFGEFALEKIVNKPEQISEINEVWSWQNKSLSEGKLQRFTNEEMASLPYLNPKFNTFYQLYYKPYLDDEPDSHLSIDTAYSALGLDVNHGCPFNCSYCSVHIFGHNITEYTTQRAVDELEKTAKETGIFMYTYTNSNLMFVRREWIIDFCNEILKRKMENYVSWSGYHHPNTINLLSVEDLKLMKKAGCDQIVIGIQSVEPRILEIFNRHKNTYEIFRTINEKTKEAGLELVIDYIRGVPGEDLDIVEEFYDYCVKNKIEMREFLLKIYPNTDIKNKNIDFSGYELIPITGNMAEDLDSFAVVPKKNEPRNQMLSMKINNSNAEIKKNRKIRLGQSYITSEAQAHQLKDTEIPNNPHIPERVKTAMIKMLDVMLNPTQKDKPQMHQSPQQMMKALVMADENAPPMMKEMQTRLKKELGEEKFEVLHKKFSSEQ